MKSRECEIRHGPIDKIRKLARLSGRRVVAFDIEHTGYVDGVVAVTEFAAIAFDADGVVEMLNTLVNPGNGVKFNPMATQVSGITKATVKNAPLYQHGVADFVFGYENDLWVGFNSNASDIPILKKEHGRLEIRVPEFSQKLDVMKFGKKVADTRGSLSEIVRGINSRFALDAHVAMADVCMTVFLLESLLNKSTMKDLRGFGLLP